MNNLSWFIYFTEVAGNLRGFLQVFSGVALLVVGLAGIPALISKFDEFMGDGSFYAAWRPVANWVIPAALFGFFVAGLIPTQRTLILMAGSEFGERVAKSEDVQSIVNPGMDLVRKWIKQEADKIKDKS
jgi:hypothetical protein